MQRTLTDFPERLEEITDRIEERATKMAKINLYYTDYVYQIYLTMDVVGEIINKGDKMKRCKK